MDKAELYQRQLRHDPKVLPCPFRCSTVKRIAFMVHVLQLVHLNRSAESPAYQFPITNPLHVSRPCASLSIPLCVGIPLQAEINKGSRISCDLRCVNAEEGKTGTFARTVSCHSVGGVNDCLTGRRSHELVRHTSVLADILKRNMVVAHS